MPKEKDERCEKKIDDRQDAVKKLKVAGILQYTLPGVPLIFYGDEAGLEGYEDPFNRRCYPWGREDKDLIEFFTRLGEIRKENSLILASGKYLPVYADKGVLVYERESENGKIKVIANAQKDEYVLSNIAYDEVTKQEVKSVAPYTAIIIKE